MRRGLFVSIYFGLAIILSVFLYFRNTGIPTRNLAQDHGVQLSADTFISWDDINKLYQDFPKIEEDKHFYHWTKIETGLRWSLQGNIHQGEIDFYNTPSGTRQMAGAGIYLAESPTSSKGFGPYPCTFKIKAGTPIYDQDIVQDLVGKSLTRDEMTELGKHLPFMRNYSGDWWITHHPENASTIKYAATINPDVKADLRNLKNPIELYRSLSQIKDIDHVGHLKSLMTLTHYMEGASFARAMYINPDNPWQEFEPEHFKKYENTLDEYLDKISKTKEINDRNGPFKDLSKADKEKLLADNIVGISSAQWLRTADEEKEDYVRRISDYVLPDLYRKVSGNNSIDTFRSEGIRAGGTYDNNTFRATTAQLSVLLNNPYVEVEHTPHPDGNGHLVHYYYPDVYHYKKLKGKISEELFDQIESIDPSRFDTDSALRQKLNSTIISELLHDLIDKYYGKPAAFTSNDSVLFLRDLMSIHPFPDFNGRVIRLFYYLSHIESGQIPPYAFTWDIDLVTSPSMLKRLLKAGSDYQLKLQQQFLEELLTSMGGSRAPPDYSKNKILEKLFDTVVPLGHDESEVVMDNDLARLIYDRRFNLILDDVIGKNWQYADLEAVFSVFSNSFDDDFKDAYMAKLEADRFFEILNEEKLTQFIDENYNRGDDDWFKILTIIYSNSEEELKGTIHKKLDRIIAGNINNLDSNELNRFIINLGLKYDDYGKNFQKYLFSKDYLPPDLAATKGEFVDDYMKGLLEKYQHGKDRTKVCSTYVSQYVKYKDYSPNELDKFIKASLDYHQADLTHANRYIDEVFSLIIKDLPKRDTEIFSKFIKYFSQDEIRPFINISSRAWQSFLNNSSSPEATKLYQKLLIEFLEKHRFGADKTYNNDCINFAKKYVVLSDDYIKNFKYVFNKGIETLKVESDEAARANIRETLSRSFSNVLGYFSHSDDSYKLFLELMSNPKYESLIQIAHGSWLDLYRKLTNESENSQKILAILEKKNLQFIKELNWGVNTEGYGAGAIAAYIQKGDDPMQRLNKFMLQHNKALERSPDINPQKFHESFFNELTYILKDSDHERALLEFIADNELYHVIHPKNKHVKYLYSKFLSEPKIAKSFIEICLVSMKKAEYITRGDGGYMSGLINSYLSQSQYKIDALKRLMDHPKVDNFPEDHIKYIDEFKMSVLSQYIQGVPKDDSTIEKLLDLIQEKKHNSYISWSGFGWKEFFENKDQWPSSTVKKINKLEREIALRELKKQRYGSARSWEANHAAERYYDVASDKPKAAKELIDLTLQARKEDQYIKINLIANAAVNKLIHDDNVPTKDKIAFMEFLMTPEIQETINPVSGDLARFFRQDPPIPEPLIKTFLKLKEKSCWSVLTRTMFINYSYEMGVSQSAAGELIRMSSDPHTTLMKIMKRTIDYTQKNSEYSPQARRFIDHIIGEYLKTIPQDDSGQVEKLIRTLLQNKKYLPYLSPQEKSIKTLFEHNNPSLIGKLKKEIYPHYIMRSACGHENTKECVSYAKELAALDINELNKLFEEAKKKQLQDNSTARQPFLDSCQTLLRGFTTP